MPWRPWDCPGNQQRKVARWHPPFLWGSEEMRTPPREREHAGALRLAAWVRARAEERERCAARPELRERWLRSLEGELRSGVGGHRHGRATARHARWVRRPGTPRR